MFSDDELMEQRCDKCLEPHSEDYDCQKNDNHNPETKYRNKPDYAVLLCADCRMDVTIPFDNGDNKIRCESCATDKYKEGHVYILLPNNRSYGMGEL